MTLPSISGTIARRLLVNYRADPCVVQLLLPAPFRPHLHGEYAIVGVCLIRLEQLRPTWMPGGVGLRSENAAHRFAVVWDDEDGNEQSGAYIPRRDTNSPLNAWGGGRLFPGEHHSARFNVREERKELRFAMCSRDGEVEVRLNGRCTCEWPTESCFANVEEASAFFQSGVRGFSPRLGTNELDGIALETQIWRVEPFEARDVFSSFYSNKALFPEGSIAYDHALFMHDIPHQWYALQPITRQNTCCR